MPQKQTTKTTRSASRRNKASVSPVKKASQSKSKSKPKEKKPAAAVDTYVAFVDQSAKDKEKFRIGLLTRDRVEDDDDVEVHVFV